MLKQGGREGGLWLGRGGGKFQCPSSVYIPVHVTHSSHEYYYSHAQFRLLIYYGRVYASRREESGGAGE